MYDRSSDNACRACPRALNCMSRSDKDVRQTGGSDGAVLARDGHHVGGRCVAALLRPSALVYGFQERVTSQPARPDDPVGLARRHSMSRHRGPGGCNEQASIARGRRSPNIPASSGVCACRPAIPIRPKLTRDPTGEGARARHQGRPRDDCLYPLVSGDREEWTEDYDGRVSGAGATCLRIRRDTSGRMCDCKCCPHINRWTVSDQVLH